MRGNIHVPFCRRAEGGDSLRLANGCSSEVSLDSTKNDRFWYWENNHRWGVSFKANRE